MCMEHSEEIWYSVNAFLSGTLFLSKHPSPSGSLLLLACWFCFLVAFRRLFPALFSLPFFSRWLVCRACQPSTHQSNRRPRCAMLRASWNPVPLLFVRLLAEAAYERNHSELSSAPSLSSIVVPVALLLFLLLSFLSRRCHRPHTRLFLTQEISQVAKNFVSKLG